MKIIKIAFLSVMTLVLLSTLFCERRTAEQHFRQGAALCDEESFEEAIKEFEKAAKKKPDHDEVYYYWGMALSELERHEEAVEKYEESVKINPELVLAYF